MLAALAACGGVLGGFVLLAAPLIGELRGMFESAGVSDAYISVIFKATAVCFITHLTCGLCRDCGETAIASAAEMWGRGVLTLMALPLTESLLDQIKRILEAGA